MHQQTLASPLTWIGLVVELLITVHPYFSSPQKVVIEDAGHPPGPAIGGGLPEHVAHPRAGHDQHLTPTHPDLRVINQPGIKTSCETMLDAKGMLG